MNVPDNPAESPPVSTVYGPVQSWRYGRSLGIDPILETSTCSFNCIYCQLGAIQRVTTQRRSFVTPAMVRRDLEPVDWPGVDVVTFSGSGEPTLAANLDQLVAVLRETTDRPLHLLTNATLLGDPAVRRDAACFDVVACKLDAPNDDILQRINRPAEGVTLAGIVAGIEALRAEYRGRLTLQIMVMPATVGQMADWLPLIRRIAPDEIHLNTPRRPYPMQWYRESRGDHDSKQYSGPVRRLRIVTREEAEQAERLLHEQTGVPIVSVYRDENR